MKNVLFRFLRSCIRTDADAVVRDVKKHLEGRVPDMVLAQAIARATRRLAQGDAPEVATRLAIIWAIHVDHPEVVS